MDCDNCANYSVAGTRLDAQAEKIDTLNGMVEKQGEAISDRPKTRILIMIASIVIGLMGAISTAQYAASADKIEAVKKDQQDQKIEVKEQYKELNKKTDDIKESMHEMNAMIREMKTLIKERNL